MLLTKAKDEKEIAQEVFERNNESKWGVPHESNQISLKHKS